MFLEISAVSILLLTFCGFFYKIWFLNIFDFPRLQLLVISFIIFVFSLWSSSLIAIVASGLAFTINFARIRETLIKTKPSLNKIKHTDLLAINCYFKNKSPDKIAALIEKVDAEHMVLCELTEDILSSCSQVLKRYKSQKIVAVRDGHSLGLFSKREFLSIDVVKLGDEQMPAIFAKAADQNDEEFLLGAVHPPPSISSHWHKTRLSYFDDLSTYLNGYPMPKLIMGDFNAVLWGLDFKRFLNKSNLISALLKQRYKMTWPTFFPVFGIPMDHILLSKDISFSGVEVGPHIGSDHLPLMLELNDKKILKSDTQQ